MNLNLLFQPFAQAFQKDGGDIFDLFFLQGLEDDDVVDTVEKFRAEILFQQVADLFVGFFKILRFEDFMRA